ncbi:MAG: PspA/IM30 family protein [Abitibacteriaceae bacterium]|nr:PspA/IM30 family protein [Abditibacteriaceae bacterium]MBV9867900.1 PspA/IM30 family protein [Abditibacteriaceae bacterium]
MALGDILGRVGSILSANVNELLDRAEDPVKMSAEFLRKANSELAEVRHEVAMVIASYEDTRRAYAENEADITDWQNKAHMALTAGREDLARKALAEKQREEQENNDLRVVLDEQKKQVDSLKAAAEQLRGKIADMERQRDVLVAQHRTAIARQHVQQVASGIGNSQALAGFDRLKKRTQHEMSVATAMESLDSGSLEDEFKQLQSGGGDAKVDAELAAMKAQMGLAAPRATPELPEGFVQQ